LRRHIGDGVDGPQRSAACGRVARGIDSRIRRAAALGRA